MNKDNRRRPTKRSKEWVVIDRDALVEWYSKETDFNQLESLFRNGKRVYGNKQRKPYLTDKYEVFDPEILEWILEDEIPEMRLFIYLIIKKDQDDDNRPLLLDNSSRTISLELVASDLGVSEETVQEWLNNLNSYGCIDVEGHGTEVIIINPSEIPGFDYEEFRRLIESDHT